MALMGISLKSTHRPSSADFSAARGKEEREEGNEGGKGDEWCGYMESLKR